MIFHSNPLSIPGPRPLAAAVLATLLLAACSAGSLEKRSEEPAKLTQTQSTIDQAADTDSAPDMAASSQAKEGETVTADEKVVKTDDEWKELLDPMQYEVLREKGTERAFTGEYWDSKADGTYVCAGCNQKLFHSDTKYESGTGWPSFWDTVDASNIELLKDRKLWMVRTEVVCSRCDGHLGHVFDDGPRPTGLRYCMNSAALRLIEDE